MSNPLVERLISALNSHDLDAVASCFGPDFSGEWPAHPGRDVQGPEQVRRNWDLQDVAGDHDRSPRVICVGADIGPPGPLTYLSAKSPSASTTGAKIGAGPR